MSRENKEYDDEKSRQLSAKENKKRPKILLDDIVDDEDSTTFVVTCRKAKNTETIYLEMPSLWVSLALL